MCVCVSWLTLVHNEQTWISYPHLLSLVARWLCWFWHQDHSVSFTFWVRTPKWVILNYLHWQGSVFLPYYWFKPLPQGAKLSVDDLDLVLWSFELPYLQYCCTCSFPIVLNAWNISNSYSGLYGGPERTSALVLRKHPKHNRMIFLSQKKKKKMIQQNSRTPGDTIKGRVSERSNRKREETVTETDWNEVEGSSVLWGRKRRRSLCFNHVIHRIL